MHRLVFNLYFHSKEMSGVESEPMLGHNSSAGSVLGSLSCLMLRCGFDPPLRRIFPVEGILPLKLPWVLTQFPQNSFG